MGGFWKPLLGYFFDFWCTAQCLYFFILFEATFEAALKGKSRCFVMDILQKSTKHLSSKMDLKSSPQGLHFGTKI